MKQTRQMRSSGSTALDAAMRNIKLTIEYSGTHFCGWQIQRGQRTVQGEIEQALKRVFQRKIRVIGSGRTDAKAHAIAQVANFQVNSKIPAEKIAAALNAHLPMDVAITQAEDVTLSFHAQFSAKHKTYRYVILNRRARAALGSESCYHVPQRINLNIVRSEAKNLVGRKDFRSFMATDPEERDRPTPKDTVRTISKLSIKKSGDFIIIEITANGFLYKMVRNMIGTLLDVANGKLPRGSIKKILSQRSRVSAGMTAPAQGLTLVNVQYARK